MGGISLTTAIFVLLGAVAMLFIVGSLNKPKGEFLQFSQASLLRTFVQTLSSETANCAGDLRSVQSDFYLRPPTVTSLTSTPAQRARITQAVHSCTKLRADLESGKLQVAAPSGFPTLKRTVKSQLVRWTSQNVSLTLLALTGYLSHPSAASFDLYVSAAQTTNSSADQITNSVSHSVYLSAMNNPAIFTLPSWPAASWAAA